MNEANDRTNTKKPAGVWKFSRGLIVTMRLRNRSGQRSVKSNEQSHDRGRRDTIKLSRATRDWDGVGRAKLLNGFRSDTSGRPACSFPSGSCTACPTATLDAKLECFSRHGFPPWRRDWSALKKQDTQVIDIQQKSSPLFLVSLPRLRVGWNANNSLWITQGVQYRHASSD